jgi:hypothetical protein
MVFRKAERQKARRAEKQPAASRQTPASSSQQPAASSQQLAANSQHQHQHQLQQPDTSSQTPAASSQHRQQEETANCTNSKQRISKQPAAHKGSSQQHTASSQQHTQLGACILRHIQPAAQSASSKYSQFLVSCFLPSASWPSFLRSYNNSYHPKGRPVPYAHLPRQSNH